MFVGDRDPDIDDWDVAKTFTGREWYQLVIASVEVGQERVVFRVLEQCLGWATGLPGFPGFLMRTVVVTGFAGR